MRKTNYQKRVCNKTESQLGQLKAELATLRGDDSIEGLQKRRDIMIKLALLDHTMDVF